MSEAALVEARGLVKSFAAHGALGSAGPELRAVDGVDLTIRPREILGLVGESGSGKSTTGRMLVRLLEPEAGTIRFDGEDLLALRGKELRRRRREFQIVFQDPYAALNPRMRVGSLVGEPLAIHKIGAGRADRQRLVSELLERVGLDPSAALKYPHEFSGGQRQRIGIARAIACSPRFLVADEPVSALDPSVQAQILNLLLDLQRDTGMAYLFIAHDLRVVEHLCHRVAVMYLGRVVEEAPAERLYSAPAHPYTRALLQSTPALKPGRTTPPALQGEPASAAALPQGCRFHPRCPVAVPECTRIDPPLRDLGDGHRAACILVGAEAGEAP